MNRDVKDFHVGDFIGDVDDNCWRVDNVSDDTYTITDLYHRKSKTITRGCTTRHSWDDYSDADNYHLLRPCGHSDITNFPIGSEWKCTKYSGLVTKSNNRVIIEHYAHSENVFWVHNKTFDSILFVVGADNLHPISRKVLDK